MLVLARKIDETIKIGESVVITVLQVKGRMVKIGITAPRDVRVMRGELTPLVADQANDQDQNTLLLEATLDVSQLATADGVVCDSLWGEAHDAEARDGQGRDVDEEETKLARGLSSFRRSRQRQNAETPRVPAVGLVAATAN